jgi:hypothetical protein
VGVSVAMVDWDRPLVDVCATTRSKAAQTLTKVAQEKKKKSYLRTKSEMG